jgi:four helix bundle protein
MLATDEASSRAPCMAPRFEILELALELINTSRPLIAALERFDGDLARQIRRACMSSALNLAEGNRRSGRDRLHCFRIAAGSNEEARVGFRIASFWISSERELIDVCVSLTDRIGGMGYRLTNIRSPEHPTS